MRLRYFHSGGFTFVDMMSLVGVTFLLLTIALPQVNTSRDAARQASCLKNQRKLVGAMLAHAMDNEDEIISSQGLPGGGFWPFAFLNQKMTVLEARNTVQSVFKSSPLFTYIQEVDVIHCPGDYRSSKHKPGFGWAYDSYAKTEPMNGLGWQPGGQKPFKYISEIETPDMTLSFVESTDPRDYNRGSWVMNVPPSPNWVDNFGIFHGSESTFSYVDGHADAHSWRDSRLMEASENANNGKLDFFWSGGNIENPDYRWVYQRYRFKGWEPLMRTQE